VLLSALPKKKLPIACFDHFLFYEKLKQPYRCVEQPSALGLLMSGEGSCYYRVNGVQNRVAANQLFLINYQSKLAIHTPKKESAPALLFFHSRLPDLIRHSVSASDEQLLEQNECDSYNDFSWLERLHYTPTLTATIQSLILLGSSCSSFASLKADIMIRNLFEKLLRENRLAAKLSKNIRAIKVSTRLEIFKRIDGVREWMESNSSLTISLEDMAGIAHMNSQHFLRMFKQVHQVTPHQYLIELRLQKAKQLLHDTTDTVASICHAIGFESVYSFTHLFRKKFGLPPAAYRKQ
jgi:AraC-like DNA-binding protein